MADCYRISETRWSKIPRRSLVLAISGVMANVSFAGARAAAGTTADGAAGTARLSLGAPRSEDRRTLGAVDLKSLGPDQQVTAIGSSNDVYRVTTVREGRWYFPNSICA